MAGENGLVGTVQPNGDPDSCLAGDLTWQPRGSGGPPSGPAGGDLAGTYPDPTLAVAYQPLSEKGAASGYASLDAGTKVPVAQLPQVAQLTVPFVADASAAKAWTNMPLAENFLFGSHRGVMKADLTLYTQCRLLVNKQATAGAAAAILFLKYRTTFSTTATDYSAIGSSAVQVAVNVQNTVLDSGWVSLVAGAKADVFVTVNGSGGDGAIDPAFGTILAMFR